MNTGTGLDPRIGEMLSMITRLAAGELQARTETAGAGDDLDAVITGLNMLAEELEATTAELFQERAGLEKHIAERTAILQSVLDNMSEGVIVADMSGRFRVFNKSATEMLGMGKVEAAPEQWSAVYGLYYPDSEIPYPPDQLPLARAMRGDDSSGIEIMVRNPLLGNPALISMSGRPVFDAGGQLWGGVVVFRDISRQREYEDALRVARADLESMVAELEQRNQQAGLLAELSDSMMTTADEQEAYRVAAFFLKRLLPESTGTLFVFNNSRNLMEAKASWGEESEEDFAPDECWALRRGKIHMVSEADTPLGCAHARSAPEGYYCLPLNAPELLGLLHLRLPYDRLQGLDQLIAMIGERLSLALFNLQLRYRLRNLSIRDSLTTLFNRRYLEETLDREISRAKRNGQRLGLIMADLDRFKQFNDHYGHGAGDDLLRSIGSFFRNHLRGGDVACRYGGEEFLLIMPDAEQEEVLRRAERMRLDITGITVMKGKEKLSSVTMSFGVAMYPAHGETSDELIAASDKALYQAKDAGRDRVVLAGTQASPEGARSGA